MNKKGMLLIISGPSGVGKGTVIEALRGKLAEELDRELYLSVSMTTRAPRPGEIDGVHYSFVTREDFAKLVETNGFAEFAEFAGNFYGTPIAPIHDHIAKGNIVVFDIEVVGAANMRDIFPEAVSVFITPPSFEELRRRLSGRGTESAESVEKRLRIAESECLRSSEFNHIICNDSVDSASSKILDIIKAKLA
ncbi:MAG: guanylate kinase [Clostridia bacterium]|nr:guanylate kinase [Clostridia bacterium]